MNVANGSYHTYIEEKALRQQGMFEYRLKCAHALTCADSGVRIENSHGRWHLVDLAMCHDWKWVNGITMSHRDRDRGISVFTP